jgi:hypothetical protein
MFGRYLVVAGAILLGAAAKADEVKYKLDEIITVPRLGLNMVFGDECYQRKLTMSRGGFTLGAFHNREGYDTEAAQNEADWWIEYERDFGPVTIGGGVEQVNLPKSDQRLHDLYGYAAVGGLLARGFGFSGPNDGLTGFYGDVKFTRELMGVEVAGDVSYNDGLIRDGSGIGHVGVSASKSFPFNGGDLVFTIGGVWDLTRENSAYDTTGYAKTVFSRSF